MAWQTGDIVGIKLIQRYLDQELINTLFYEIVNTVGDVLLSELFEFISAVLVDALVPLQIANVEHFEQQYDNLTNGVDFFITNKVAIGDAGAGAPTASFTALGMTKIVGTKITRPGSIRIAGLSEAATDGNTLSAGTIANALITGDLLSTALGFVDSGGDQMTLVPVVVGRTELGFFDLARINPVIAMVSPRQTTQNSRKAGR